MLEEIARVVKIENHQVWIESSTMNGCASCQQKASCSTNAIGSVLKKKQVPVDSDIQLNPGDNVLVAIDESVLLRASLLLYFLPILALFMGAGISNWLLSDNNPHADLWNAVSAFSGFLLMLWLINRTQSLYLLSSARPVVVRKI
jgi:sigma-E factor negative regulatory protein RseC